MTKPTQRLAIIVAALCTSVFAGACDLFGGQTGQEDRSSTGIDRCAGIVPPVADGGIDGGSVDDASPQDVADALRGPFTAPFEWTQGHTLTRVVIEVRRDGSGSLLARDGECRATLELPVTLSIATDDGLLDERVATTLTATTAHAGTLHVSIPFSTLAGSYDGSDLQHADASRADLLIEVELFNGATRGTVRSGSDSVATWPAEP